MTTPTASAEGGGRVAVALSGGTDSALAAALLQEAGAQVTALTLRLVSGTSHAHDPVPRARTVARQLGIAHVVLDCRDRFEAEIVRYFVDSYLGGETPSPCCHCNRQIKFGVLLDAALDQGCDTLATGHYVRTTEQPSGRIRLRRGLDAGKDQSYFLFSLGQPQLRRACFPLGRWRKKDVREAASRRGLAAAETGESQDLCFVADSHYADFVASRQPNRCQRGAIVSTGGTVLGTHNGFFRYTIGQRQGLGLPGGPWYVVALRPDTNEVVVGRRQDAERSRIRVRGLSWHTEEPFAESAVDSRIQLRYRMKPVRVISARQIGQTEGEIDLAEPVHGAAAGQAAVFYRDDCLLGGGWIDAATP